VGVLLLELEPVVVVVGGGTTTRRVVVCSTVAVVISVVAGAVVVSTAVVVSVVVSVVVVSAAWPPVAIAPAISAPAAKRTTPLEILSALGIRARFVVRGWERLTPNRWFDARDAALQLHAR
jgi:ABC-type nitrate/sulfonate/bicarbonate transport system permease component